MTNIEKFIRCFESDFAEMEKKIGTGNLHIIKHDNLLNIFKYIFSCIGNDSFFSPERDLLGVKEYYDDMINVLRGVADKDFYFVIKNREKFFFNDKKNISDFFAMVFDFYEYPNIHFIIVASDEVKIGESTLGMLDEDLLTIQQKNIIRESFSHVKYVDGEDSKDITTIGLTDKYMIAIKNQSLDAVFDCLSDEEFFMQRPSVIVIPKEIQKSQEIITLLGLINDLHGRRTLPLYILVVNHVSEFN